jgi:hypothetical protein
MAQVLVHTGAKKPVGLMGDYQLELDTFDGYFGEAKWRRYTSDAMYSLVRQLSKTIEAGNTLHESVFFDFLQMRIQMKKFWIDMVRRHPEGCWVYFQY